MRKIFQTFPQRSIVLDFHQFLLMKRFATKSWNTTCFFSRQRKEKNNIFAKAYMLFDILLCFIVEAEVRSNEATFLNVHIKIDSFEPHYVSNCFQSSDATFQELCGVPKQYANKLISCWNNEVMQRKGGPRLFSACSEVHLMLLHLRHYPTYIFLASCFETSKQTLNNVCTTLLQFFSSFLEHKINFGTLEQRLEDSFEMLKQRYTFVIDGTEQKAPSSKNPSEDFASFSVKKKQTSTNTLLLCSPSGKTLYISPCFPGGTNDSEIVQQTKEEWQKHLDLSQECGIGDSGFEGLVDLGIHSPPASPDLYKIYSQKRIKVENINANFKDWHCLHLPVRKPTKLSLEETLKIHHMRWIIVGAFLNDRRNNWKL